MTQATTILTRAEGRLDPSRSQGQISTPHRFLTFRTIFLNSTPRIEIKHRGKDKRLTDEERRLLKRRQAIEPIIGHLKADHRMDRCHLKGSAGDAILAVLCAAGYNIRWLLRMIAKKGLGLLLCLLQAAGLTALLAKVAEIIGRNQLHKSDQRWVLACNEFCRDDY